MLGVTQVAAGFPEMAEVKPAQVRLAVVDMRVQVDTARALAVERHQELVVAVAAGLTGKVEVLSVLVAVVAAV